ncbi:SDR family oxidoreductase [Acuticoccus sp. M5D2P5]|uniref:SDR family NAD(P)-dependent oxidoreductase n=1 Tax=Acuticoccus kalidii TaxID=2910977 RepID=UPI001F406260|nr:SDR family oxidoreductase [Acuticoccus kalidii]MCF3933596.1 SDR family oxidoreductase [Acuticoccus kalidii]
MGTRLANKTAIITGGGGGIGGATARLFCEEGARVVIVDPSDRGIERVLGEVKAAMPDAPIEAINADVSKESECVRVVEAAKAAFGGVDVLVNCAGVRSYEPLAEAKEETWRWILDVNLLSYAFMAKAALPELRRSGKSSIVNISSTYGVYGRKGMGQYDATKAGILALTRTLAFEEIEHGVRVNSMCPGLIMTPFHVERLGRTPEELLAEDIDMALIRRWAEPREMAYPILWLASDEASYITATTIMADGGRPVL